MSGGPGDDTADAAGAQGPEAGKAEAGNAKEGPRQLDGEGRPYLTLAQFLKREKLADSGGAAKHLARSGAVTVNGEAEARPGRKLREGDRVLLQGRELVVRLGPPAA